MDNKTPDVVQRKPKPYLKRGTGLARFNLSTDLEKQPNRILKKKQPNIKNLPSKYHEVGNCYYKSLQLSRLKIHQLNL